MVTEKRCPFYLRIICINLWCGSRGMDDEDEKIEKFEPLNLYGWSKQNFDLHAKKAGWLIQS